MLPTKKYFPTIFPKKGFDESPSEDQKYYFSSLENGFRKKAL
jgi:hypothetical protein